MIKDIESDVELGMSLIDSENRGLTTDMLGIPKLKHKEAVISAAELAKLTQKEDISYSYTNLKLNNVVDKTILETLDNILNEW
jgi:hypothetical protein